MTLRLTKSEALQEVIDVICDADLRTIRSRKASFKGTVTVGDLMIFASEIEKTANDGHRLAAKGNSDVLSVAQSQPSVEVSSLGERRTH